MNRKVSGYFFVLRPINCVMMVVAVYAAAVVATRSLFVPDLRLVYAFATAFLLTGFAMVVNDIYDVETDRVNEPSRPLPSGVISIPAAWKYALLLAAFGLVFAAYDGPVELGLASVSLGLSLLYSGRLKLSGLAGNFAVSYNVGLPFLYGGLVTSGLKPVLFIFFWLAFLSNTGREIIKGVSEVQGDMVRGAKTIAIRYGRRRGSIIASVFTILSVALSPLPVLTGGVSTLGYAVPLSFADGLFLYLTARLMSSPENAGFVKRNYKLPMALAILSFISGALF